MIKGISAVTLATHDMRRAVKFYRLLELPVVHGGEEASFTSFRAGDNFLNLIAQPAERRWSWWGRLIFYHADVDALHARLVAAGCRPDSAPRDAPMGRALLPHHRPGRASAELCLAPRASPPRADPQRANQWRSSGGAWAGGTMIDFRRACR